MFTLTPCPPDQLDAVLDLFWETVHTINAQDYTPDQLDAWAPGTRTGTAGAKSGRRALFGPPGRTGSWRALPTWKPRTTWTACMFPPGTSGRG